MVIKICLSIGSPAQRQQFRYPLRYQHTYTDPCGCHNQSPQTGWLQTMEMKSNTSVNRATSSGSSLHFFACGCRAPISASAFPGPAPLCVSSQVPWCNPEAHGCGGRVPAPAPPLTCSATLNSLQMLPSSLPP